MSHHDAEGNYVPTTVRMSPELALRIRDLRAEGKFYTQICAQVRKEGFKLSPPDITHHIARNTPLLIDGEERGFAELFAEGQEALEDKEYRELEIAEKRLLKVAADVTEDDWRSQDVRAKALSFYLKGRLHRMERRRPRKLELSGHVGGPERVLVVPESQLFETPEAGDEDR